jgi:hypothetical protein
MLLSHTWDRDGMASDSHRDKEVIYSQNPVFRFTGNSQTWDLIYTGIR